MSDLMHPDPIDSILAAELAALADGSLPPEHVAALERRVAASPELQEALAGQRHAREATRELASAPAPDRLHEAVAAMVAEAATPRGPARRKWWTPRLRWAMPAAALTALVLAIAIGTGGGSPTPSVAEAARTALRPPTHPAPVPRPRTNELAVTVDGVAFPDWYASEGWRAVGTRGDVVGGRRVRTVVYANRGGQRIGYAIVAGDALPAPAGRTVVRNGVRMRVLGNGGASVVSWRRKGRTCILAARGVDAGTLVRLASWSSS